MAFASASAFAFASASALAFASSAAFTFASASAFTSARASASSVDRSTEIDVPGNSRSRSPASVSASSFSRDSPREGRTLISPAMIDDGTTGDSAPVSIPIVRGTRAFQSTSTTAWPRGSVGLGFLPLPFPLPPPMSPEPSRTIGVATTPAPPTSHSSSASIARCGERARVDSRRRRMPTCAARSAMRRVSNTRYGLSSSASATVRWPSNRRSTPWTSVGIDRACCCITPPSCSYTEAGDSTPDAARRSIRNRSALASSSSEVIGICCRRTTGS